MTINKGEIPSACSPKKTIKNYCCFNITNIGNKGKDYECVNRGSSKQAGMTITMMGNSLVLLVDRKLV